MSFLKPILIALIPIAVAIPFLIFFTMLFNHLTMDLPILGIHCTMDWEEQICREK